MNITSTSRIDGPLEEAGVRFARTRQRLHAMGLGVSDVLSYPHARLTDKHGNAKGMRFAPGGIPAGVDQGITLPHDCENHLDITNEVLRRGW